MNYKVTAKRIIKGVASPILDFCGIYDALLDRRVFAQPNWLILMYHRVIEDRSEDPYQLGMCIDSALFEEQVRYHVEHFTPILLGDAVARLRTGKPLPRNAVSFTFDDGYRDFKDTAVPILKRYQCPSTVFVTTGGLQEQQAFWWDRVIDAVSMTTQRSVDSHFLAPGSGETLSLAPRNRNPSLQRLLGLFWAQPPERLEEQVERFREKLGVTGSGQLQAPRMNHDEIASLATEDVEIGAHCEQHVDMRSLTAEQRRHELEASRRVLQDISGQAVNGFAFPGGRQNIEVRKQVAHAGFTYAAGTHCGLNRAPFDTYNLYRLGAPDAGVPDYKRCLASAAGPAPPQMELESVQWP